VVFCVLRWLTIERFWSRRPDWDPAIASARVTICRGGPIPWRQPANQYPAFPISNFQSWSTCQNVFQVPSAPTKTLKDRLLEVSLYGQEELFFSPHHHLVATLRSVRSRHYGLILLKSRRETIICNAVFSLYFLPCFCHFFKGILFLGSIGTIQALAFAYRTGFS